MPCSFMKCQCGRPYLPQRYVMVILVWLALIITYVQRIIFNMVISYLAVKKNATICPCGDVQEPDQTSLEEWDRFAQALLLSSFFVGYILMLLPGGYMADKLGGRFVCIASVFSSSLVTIFFPLIVNNTYFWLICAGRAFVGGANACVLTSSASLIARWLPRNEWSTVCGTVFGYVGVGFVFGYVLGGLAEDSIGWQPIYYIWGGIGMVWCILGLLWLYSSPAVHPSMTNREKTFLEQETERRNPTLPLDWVAILTDPAVGAIAAAQVGYSYIAFMLISTIPSYYVYVMGLNLDKNIVVLIVPPIMLWILAILFGILADYFIHSKNWKPSIVRKVYYTIACTIPAVFILIIPLVECNELAVILLASFGIVLMAPFFCSLRVNALDITYNYPGFVTGAVMICGAVVSALKPYTTELITQDNTFPQWRIVAYIIFGNALFNNILYIFMGSCKRRLWDLTPEDLAKYKEQKQKEDEAKKAANSPEAKEAAKKKAEEEKKAKDEKKKADQERKKAEQEQKKAEQDQKKAEQQQKKAEQDRLKAEKAAQKNAKQGAK